MVLRRKRRSVAFDRAKIIRSDIRSDAMNGITFHVNKTISRGINTPLFRDGHIIENCVKTIRDNFKFVNFKGPTGEEIAKELNMNDKICLITGANTGIGLEVARCLTSRDCNVLMACRNTYDASIAGNNFFKNLNRLKFYELNLASLDSVKKCSKSLLESQTNIDIVILNAGTFGLPWTQTEDGLETTFQVNFLSQYYLLLSLEKILAPNARIVFVSSESHRNVILPEDAKVLPTLEHLSLSKEKYTSIRAYNVSKLCGLLAMRYLHYRWLHTDKSVFCAHPGTFVMTGLCRNWWVFEALYLAMLPFSKSVGQAASTVLYCATSPDLLGHSGLYFKDCKHCEESELAKNTYLSFRIHDLVCDTMRDRGIDCNTFHNVANNSKLDRAEQNQYEDQIISNC